MFCAMCGFSVKILSKLTQQCTGTAISVNAPLSESNSHFTEGKITL